MFYHVRISQKSVAKDETKVDLSEEELTERIVKPYENGDAIVINGKTILSSEIERIKISKSDKPSAHIIPQLKIEDERSQFLTIGGPSYEWRVADRATDITDEIILGPVGYKKEQTGNQPITEPKTYSNKKIFVVHGHDEALKNETEIFLRDIDLDPIVLHRKPDEGLTIIEKIEKYSDVRFALVLLTPDDIGYPIIEHSKKESERKIEYRARQNVFFELGFFVGLLGRSYVITIYKEPVSLPTDLHGLLYKKVESSIEEIGFALMKEFSKGGLEPIYK